MAIFTDEQYDDDIGLMIEDSPCSFVIHYAGDVDFNPKTGEASVASSQDSVVGLADEMSVREVEMGHGRFSYGDVMFFARVADMTEDAAPTTRDWVIWRNYRYNLIHTELDPSERLWVLIGRRAS